MAQTAQAFPSVVEFTSDVFPRVPEDKEATDLVTDVPANEVARCSSCFAYANPFVKFSKHHWQCALCKTHNRIPPRYQTRQQRETCEELKHPVLDFLVAEGWTPGEIDWVQAAAESRVQSKVRKEEDVSAVSQQAESLGLLSPAAYLFVVDLSGGSDYVELIKNGILAAIEALPDSVRVGLLVFSDKLGVYDLRCSTPHVRYLSIPAEEQSLEVHLSALLHLNEFFVPLADCKDHLGSAVESLESHYWSEEEEDAEDRTAEEKKPDKKPVERRRALGSTLDSVLTFIEEESSFFCRVLLFMAGMPNHGLGKMKPDRFKGSTERDQTDTLLLPTTNFYKTQGGVPLKGFAELCTGEALAHAGVCVDLFMVSELQFVELASLKFLTLLTGGNLVLYETAEEASLPQDLFRQLAKKQAFRGLLRMRTSREFQIHSVFGHLVADSKYDSVFHIAGCDCRKTLAVDFEFSTVDGFDGWRDALPHFQLAFAYTVMEKRVRRREKERILDVQAEEAEEKKEQIEVEWEEYEIEVPVRRLRIANVQLDVAESVLSSYHMTHPDIVVQLLVHQVIQECQSSGVVEARTLLQDWLSNLIACYNEATTPEMNVMKGDKEKLKSAIDTDFKRARPLQFLSRFIFAMLKHPFLSAENIHPDVRTFLQCLFTALEPAYLVKALYPSLCSYTDPDTLAKPALFLSHQALEHSKDPIFVMDAFTGIFVHYTGAALAFPLPPPHESAVRKRIKAIKQQTPIISPRIVFSSTGSSEGRYFESHMLEEKGSAGFSFTHFMESISEDTFELIRSM